MSLIEFDCTIRGKFTVYAFSLRCMSSVRRSIFGYSCSILEHVIVYLVVPPELLRWVFMTDRSLSSWMSPLLSVGLHISLSEIVQRHASVLSLRQLCVQWRHPRPINLMPVDLSLFSRDALWTVVRPCVQSAMDWCCLALPLAISEYPSVTWRNRVIMLTLCIDSEHFPDACVLATFWRL